MVVFLTNGLIAGAVALLLWRARVIAHRSLAFQKWHYYSGVRSMKGYLMYVYVLNAIFSYRIPSPFTNSNISRSVVNDFAASLDQDAARLRLSDESHEPIAGYDAELDFYTIGEGCPVIEKPTTMHDLYNCTGASQLVRIFSSLAMAALDNLERYNGTLDSMEPANMLHLLDRHLEQGLMGIAARINVLAASARSEFARDMVLIYVAGLLAAVAAFGLSIAFLNDFDIVYRVLLSLLQRLPPDDVVAHAPLLDYILGKQRSGGRGGMSAVQGIVQRSPDGIVLASPQGIIDYVNPALSAILDYCPEDLLGQPLARVFDDEMNAQLALLQERQLSGEMHERTILCRTSDDARTVLCNVVMIGMCDADKELSDLVLIVRDVSGDHEREIESQRAKEKSETLLFAILPRSIVSKLEAGTDPTFTVQIASIMFIDIIKFNQFSKELAPEQILGTLGAIFGSFDARITRWGLVTKIKLIGDVYMCAAGLFDDTKPAAAAEEIVHYAIECLQCLDDQNMKMGIALSVRIGINTGGPIIAGVLGNENQVFDIIGDAINVAARLQTTSRPNTIQMSAAMQEYIAPRAFPLERRDNVVLKGKEGTVATYLLSTEGSVSLTLGS